MAKKEEKSNDDALQLIIDGINKKFGKGTIIDLNKIDKTIKKIKTGIIGLDNVLGGGWPLGRMIEIYGKNAAGKTTMVIEAIKQFQKECPDKIVVLFDCENKISIPLMESMGVDTSAGKLLFSQAFCIEEIEEIMENVMPLGVSAIFIDSLAAMATMREIEGEMGKEDAGHKAKVLSKFWRKVVPVANANQTMICVTNQIRFKTGVMYGSPETTPGGEGTRYAASIRLLMKKKDILYENKNEIGQQVELYVEKNQVASPYKSAILNLIWGKGFDTIASLVDTALVYDVLVQSGSWIVFPDGSKVQGRDKAAEIIINNEVLYKELYSKVAACVK